MVIRVCPSISRVSAEVVLRVYGCLSGFCLLRFQILFRRNFGFAGNSCLTQTAPVPVKTIICFYIIRGNRPEMAQAFDLVVPRLG